jgi:hypothetical protein
MASGSKVAPTLNSAMMHIIQHYTPPTCSVNDSSPSRHHVLQWGLADHSDTVHRSILDGLVTAILALFFSRSTYHYIYIYNSRTRARVFNDSFDYNPFWVQYAARISYKSCAELRDGQGRRPILPWRSRVR